jgi:anti-anti-sigma factor
MAEHHYSLSGEVDMGTAKQVRADLSRVIRSNGGHLLIDCTDLTFIDSIGVTVLLEAHRRLEAGGRHMVLVNVSGAPRVVLESLGLTDLLRLPTSSHIQPAVRGRPEPGH